MDRRVTITQDVEELLTQRLAGRDSDWFVVEIKQSTATPPDFDVIIQAPDVENWWRFTMSAGAHESRASVVESFDKLVNEQIEQLA